MLLCPCFPLILSMIDNKLSIKLNPPLSPFLEYTVKVNLFNRFNEKCEMSRKEVAVFRKNGMHEQKQLPPLFEFSGDPSVYHVQVKMII